MKQVKLLQCLAIIFAVVFCASALTATAVNEKNILLAAPTDRSEQYYIAQAESIRAYSDILNSFSANNDTILSQNMSKSTPYPDYFGGAYIDTDTGGLTVMVTNQPAIQTIQSVCATRNANITYKLCKTSYAQLKSLHNTIVNQIDDLKKDGIVIAAVSIGNEEQKVYVDVLALTAEKEEILRTAFNSPLLSLRASSAIATPSAFGPGNRIKNCRTTEDCTLGFAAMRNGVPGFVSAGHYTQVGDIFICNGETVGELTQSAFLNYTTADAAFIEADADAEQTYELARGGDIWNAIETLVPEGTLIYKYGCRTGLTSGRVSETEFVIAYDLNHDEELDHYIFDCVKASYYAEVGDSGGPIMIYEGSYGGSSKYSLCGIQSAINVSINGTFNYSMYTPYSNIVDELDVSCVVEE